MLKLIHAGPLGGPGHLVGVVVGKRPVHVAEFVDVVRSKCSTAVCRLKNIRSRRSISMRLRA